MKTIYKKLLFLLLMLPLSVLAQTTVEGVVVDSKSNQPIPGVNVIVQGTQMGTSTDFDGKFKLTKIKKGDKLVFSFIGYKNESVTFDGQKSITVSLTEEANVLQEVVVQVGYGAVKKKDATGAVDLLTTKDLNKGFNSNAESLLTGRVAGVVVTSGGRPGDGAAIRIRGGSSLGASNDPLIVLDGLPLDGGVAGSNGILSALNPNDIESYSILKDASATAIYGSRGSNGVILITTKKGAKGDVKVSVGTTVTANTLADKINTVSAADFRNFVSNSSNVSQYNIAPSRISRLGNSNTDWQDEIFSNSVSIDNNVSIKGELFKRIPAYFAYGHTYIPGILETSKFDRTNTSLKLNPSFFDNHLKIAVNANFTIEKNRYADQGAIGSAISFDPTQSVYDSNSPFGGYFEWFNLNPDNTVNYTLGGRNNLATYNPVALLEQRNNNSKAYRYFGNIQLDYKFHFFPELKATVIAGIDNQHGRGRDEISNQSKSGFIQNNLVNYGSYSTYWQKRKNKLLDSYLNYAKKFGSINVDVTGGYSYQYFESYGNSTGNIYDTNNTLANQQRVYINPDINLQSYFGRANIGLSDNKYLLTLNYRRDGSSRFSELHRWGNFPGAALAWNISQEGFLKNSKSITNLKLRLGWGVTGQQDVPAAYEYIPRYVLGNATAQYQLGNTFYITARPNGYNEDIKWEETTTYNAGIDFGIFSRLKGNLDVYRKETKDLLAFVSYPDGANLATSGYRNFGNMRSQGVELGLIYDAVKSENLNWTINFNANYQDREITALAGDSQSGFQGYPTGGFSTGDFIQIQTTGQAPNSFFVYEQVYGTDGKPLEGVYVDRNGDGLVNKNDMYHYKKPYADFTFGLMSNLNYKKWDMSMAWRASVGNYIYDDISGSRGYAQQSFGEITPLNNLSPSFLETGFVNQGGDREFSDFYVKDASFIKLDNISVGYNFNEPFGKSTTARLSFGVQNALIISKYKGIDPEVFSGIDNVIYPRARMYVFGCNVNF